MAQWCQEYWRESRRPLASLAFVLPLLLLYEGGVVVLGAQAVRNGADVWLRQILDTLGFGQYFLLPAVTVAVLLAWHHVTRDRWTLSVGVLYGMFAECATWALMLLIVGRLQGMLVQTLIAAQSSAGEAYLELPWIVGGRAAFMGRVLGFLGAGIYEELLFRLLLLAPLAWCAARLGLRRGRCVAAAVVVSSLLFAAAHYLGPHGETPDVYSFTFRAMAGGFFAMLFVYRGFGIVAGTHALYDIYVGLS